MSQSSAGTRAPGRSKRKSRRLPNWLRWTRTMKTAFLDQLAASCDVAQAAAAIGVEPIQIYALYRRDARFREQWQEALAAGYQLLETRLMGHALDTGETLGPGTPPATQLALQLLQFRHGAAKPARRPPKTMTPPTAEQVDAAILKKLAAIERRKARDSQD